MLFRSREITFQQGKRTWSGVVLGIDSEARLIVRLPDGQKQAFSTGEVSIVKEPLLSQLQSQSSDSN